MNKNSIFFQARQGLYFEKINKVRYFQEQGKFSVFQCFLYHNVSMKTNNLINVIEWWTFILCTLVGIPGTTTLNIKNPLKVRFSGIRKNVIKKNLWKKVISLIFDSEIFGEMFTLYGYIKNKDAV